jgi:hypothetical protein
MPYPVRTAARRLIVSAPAHAQDLPVTLTHEYGETVIPAKPECIATIGNYDLFCY